MLYCQQALDGPDTSFVMRDFALNDHRWSGPAIQPAAEPRYTPAAATRALTSTLRRLFALPQSGAAREADRLVREYGEGAYLQAWFMWEETPAFSRKCRLLERVMDVLDARGLGPTPDDGRTARLHSEGASY